MIRLILLSLLTFFIFSGCSDIKRKPASSDSDDNSSVITPPDDNTTDPDDNTTDPTYISGRFLDDFVVGFSYSCTSGETGVTGADGNYTCQSGDNVKFTLGTNSFIDIVATDKILTPYTLFPDDLNSSINLARVLQSLDGDGDDNNSRITIDKALEGLLPNNIDFSSPTFENSFEDVIESRLAITLPSASRAHIKLNEAMMQEKETPPPYAIYLEADAGDDRNITYNVLDPKVVLDGEATSGATYEWSFISKPNGSPDSILLKDTLNPEFIADREGEYIVELLVYQDDANVTDSVTITVIDPSAPDNYAPVITSSSTVSVDENQLNVLTVTATDADGDTLTYSLGGTNVNSFDINSSTGVITFKVAPDYETKNFYEVVTIVDDSNLSTSQDLNITILDVNDTIPNSAPLITSSPTVAVFENQIDVITLTATDAQNDTLTYSLSGTDSSSFNIDSTTGKITFKTTPDYESKNSYTLVTNVSDSLLSDSQDLNITLLNVSETPSLADTTLTVSENQPTGTSVGDIIILSHGDDTISAFTLSGNGSENFTIDASGHITTTAIFDYETLNRYAMLATATNTQGSSTAVDVLINIDNLPDTRPTLVATTLSLPEDAVANETVGVITISDSGDTNITGIAISGTGHENFFFENDGTLKVSATASFDYETTRDYNLTAVATNSIGASNSVGLYIIVNNIIDEVATLADSTGSLDENATAGTVAAIVNIVYSGDSPITEIKLSGSGSELFEASTDGTIRLISSLSLDHETTPSYVLKAIATNTMGDSNEVTLTISVLNVPEKPILADSAMSVYENLLEGTVVGTIDIITPGDSAITAITLAGTGHENFIVDRDGEVTLAPNVAIDYETTPIYNLTATASNRSGNGDSLAVNVSITIDDYEFDPTQIAKLKASDAAVNDYFGSAVAVSGNYIVVGAPSEDVDGIVAGGSAYLYKKDDNGSVSFVTKLKANDANTDAKFGTSVAIDGDNIVVGAPFSNDHGSAYFYTIEADGNASAATKFGLTSPNVDDMFATSLSISGNYIISGTPGNAAAHLFTIDSNLTKVADISEVGLTVADNYASSISISGNNIVIGAYGEDNAGTDRGAAYVYLLNPANDTVALVQKVVADTQADYDSFGISVGVSGAYVVVGAYQEDSATTNSGKAYLFKIVNSSTVTLQDSIKPDDLLADDYFGYSVSIDGHYIVIGAYQKDSPGTTVDSGSAYVYYIDTLTDLTSLTKRIAPNDASENDYFGVSVSISGDYIAVGSSQEDSGANSSDPDATDSGAIYLFDGEPAP